MQLRQQKGEMASFQTLEARITFLQTAIGCDVSLKLKSPQTHTHLSKGQISLCTDSQPSLQCDGKCRQFNGNAP